MRRNQPQRVTCADCPAFYKLVDPATDGDVLIPLIDQKTRQQVTKNGEPQFVRDVYGNHVFAGACRLRAPVLLTDGRTGFPTPNSDWWCEDPLKPALLARSKPAVKRR